MQIIEQVSNAIVRIAIDALSHHLPSFMITLGKVDRHGEVRHIPMLPKVFRHFDPAMTFTLLAPSTRAKWTDCM
jgi:hypothetical protein